MSKMQMVDYLEQSKKTTAVVEDLRPDAFKTHGAVAYNFLPIIQGGLLADTVKRSLMYKEPVEKTHERVTDLNMNLKLLNEELRTLELQETKAAEGGEATRKFTPNQIDIIHAALGVMSEGAEILEAILRSFLDGKDYDNVNIKEELGDIMWYVALGLRSVDSDFETEGYRNIQKLKTRYPNKFNTEDALSRDLNAERAVLEK